MPYVPAPRVRPNRYLDLVDNALERGTQELGGGAGVLLIVALRLALEAIKHAGD